MLRAVHRHREVLADVLDVAGRQQQLLHLLAEVEAAGAVGGQRHRPGNLGERLGEEDVAAPRMDRHVHAGQPSDPRGRRSRRVDHDRRGDGALRRPHAAHAPTLDVDAGDVHALDDAGAQLARAPREGVGDLRRAGHAVGRPPHRADEVVDAQRRHDGLGLGRRDLAHVDTQPPLQRHPLAVAGQVVGVGDQEEVADLPVADVDAELFLEALEDADGLEREADLGLGGELRADPARRLAGRPRARRVSRSSTTTSRWPRRARW